MFDCSILSGICGIQIYRLATFEYSCLLVVVVLCALSHLSKAMSDDVKSDPHKTGMWWSEVTRRPELKNIEENPTVA
jgi:hypothetical protein